MRQSVVHMLYRGNICRYTNLQSLCPSLSFPVFLVWGQSSTVIMADEADMRNELSDLQARADQVADEVL